VADMRERGTSFLKEFSDFAAKSEAVGPAMDAIHGASFRTIVPSSVDDVLTSNELIVIGPDRSNLFVVSSNHTADPVPSLTGSKGAGVAALHNSVIVNAMV
jgi:large-conductance mechanosensitive channel